MQLLALVDEVTGETVTRGDQTFRGLRDVIKKGNRVLEEMLVRRERKYTLFFRLVQPHDHENVGRIKAWNFIFEKVVGAETDSRDPHIYDSGKESLAIDTGAGGHTGLMPPGAVAVPIVALPEEELESLLG